LVYDIFILTKLTCTQDQPGKNNVKLEKNRESARNSRKRKKIYIMLLENKVFILNDKYLKTHKKKL